MTGWPSNLQTSISRAIGQFSRYYKKIYIGISVHPKERFKQHVRDNEPPYKWERCVVLYKTPSERNSNIMEGFFVKDRRTVNKSLVWSHQSRESYFYVLLAEKKN